MRILEPLVSRMAVGVAALVLLVCIAESAEQAAFDQTPIKLVNVVQGSCAKGELSTHRGCVTPPRIKKRPSPKYPATVHEDVQASIVLGVVVETDGTIASIKVINSSNPGIGFEDAATEALKRWRYKAALLGGQPVRVYLEVTFGFMSK